MHTPNLLRVRLPLLVTLASCAFAAAPALGAQELLVVDNTNDRVVLVSGVDGTVIDPVFIDLRLGGGATPTTLLQAVSAGDEVWVTDQNAGRVHRWSADGDTWLGEFGQGSDNVRGIHLAFGRVWLCNGGLGGAGYGTAVLEYDLALQLVSVLPVAGSPFGVSSLDGDLVVSESTGDDLLRIDRASGGVLGVFHDSDGVTGVDFPALISTTPTGNLLVPGVLPPVGVYEYDTSGAQVGYIDTTGIATLPQGAHTLANGNVLIGAANGLWRYERATGTFTNLLPGIDANGIAPRSGGLCDCTTYCLANPNSTGRSALMAGLGSSSVAANALTLRATRLPANTFGLFLTSRQRAFVPNPGGSQGALCLGGPIGRYVGPGQVQSSGATGTFELGVDLTQHPLPTGTAPVVPGETWHFTAWYRDANPFPTSNFADGLTVTFGQ